VIRGSLSLRERVGVRGSVKTPWLTDGSWRATMIRESRMGAMNRGARKTASGPHPGLLPGGEGGRAPRVSEG